MRGVSRVATVPGYAPRLTSPLYSCPRAGARVGAELLRGSRRLDDRRDRGGARGQRPAARRPRRRRPQPLGVHARRLRARARRRARRRRRRRAGADRPARATTARTRGSAPPTSSRSCRSTPATSTAPRGAALALGDADRRARAAGVPLRAAGSRAGLLPARRPRGAAAPARRRRDSRPTSGRRASTRSAGGVIVGARPPLIAFNVNLRGPLAAAKEIAAAVRESGRRLPRRARARPRASERGPRPGLDEHRGLARLRRPHEIVARIRAEAPARGAEVAGSELVGLIPAGGGRAASRASSPHACSRARLAG